MAETISEDTSTFVEKRKLDSCCEAKEEYPNKTQKLEAIDRDPSHAVKNGENGDHNLNAEKIDDDSSAAKAKDGEFGADGAESDDDGEEENDYEGEDEEDDEEDSDVENGVKSSENAAADRKGKGVMKDEKGKGKLIEEDDDSSDDGSDLEGGESDLSDDPLAEVDLDNILPSRTRRRTVQPGSYIATDLGNDDDDSDDSDA